MSAVALALSYPCLLCHPSLPCHPCPSSLSCYLVTCVTFVTLVTSVALVQLAPRLRFSSHSYQCNPVILSFCCLAARLAQPIRSCLAPRYSALTATGSDSSTHLPIVIATTRAITIAIVTAVALAISHPCHPCHPSLPCHPCPSSHSCYLVTCVTFATLVTFVALVQLAPRPRFSSPFLPM